MSFCPRTRLTSPTDLHVKASQLPCALGTPGLETCQIAPKPGVYEFLPRAITLFCTAWLYERETTLLFDLAFHCGTFNIKPSPPSCLTMLAISNPWYSTALAVWQLCYLSRYHWNLAAYLPT